MICKSAQVKYYLCWLFTCLICLWFCFFGRRRLLDKYLTLRAGCLVREGLWEGPFWESLTDLSAGNVTLGDCWIVNDYSWVESFLINFISWQIAILHLNVRSNLMLMYCALNHIANTCHWINTDLRTLGWVLYRKGVHSLRGWHRNRNLYLRIFRVSVRAPVKGRGGSRTYSDLGGVRLVVWRDRNSDSPVRDQVELAVGLRLIVVGSVNCLSNGHSNLTMIINQGSVQRKRLFGTEPIIQSKVRYGRKTSWEIKLPISSFALGFFTLKFVLSVFRKGPLGQQRQFEFKL